MRANVFEPDFDDRPDRPGFRHRGAEIGVQAGSERLGASLYELPAGEAICPYHAHLANEEMLIVISGTPSLRTPEGWRELQPGDVVSFRIGLEGTHQVANFADGPSRVLMVSEMIGPEVAIYPDSGKVMAREQPPGRPATGYRKLFRDSDAVDYWEGEQRPEPDA
ncbi:MAG: cupin domain-containing protein [Solirubrobacterales bacterium]